MTTIVEAQGVAWTETDTERLRELVADEDVRQWQIGDLLLERLPIGAHGVNTGVKDELKRIAAAVGAEPATLATYRKVAHAWPEGSRIPSATWAAHQAYMGSPDNAADRRKTLESLPRNEHGYITKQAVRDMTKGATGKPGWLELLGKSADQMLAAGKTLARLEAALEARGERANVTAKMRANAERYEAIARELAGRYRAIADADDDRSNK